MHKTHLMIYKLFIGNRKKNPYFTNLKWLQIFAHQHEKQVRFSSGCPLTPPAVNLSAAHTSTLPRPGTPGTPGFWRTKPPRWRQRRPAESAFPSKWEAGRTAAASTTGCWCSSRPPEDRTDNKRQNWWSPPQWHNLTPTQTGVYTVINSTMTKVLFLTWWAHFILKILWNLQLQDKESLRSYKFRILYFI